MTIKGHTKECDINNKGMCTCDSPHKFGQCGGIVVLQREGKKVYEYCVACGKRLKEV